MDKQSWRRGKRLGEDRLEAAEEAGFRAEGNDRPVKDFKQECAGEWLAGDTSIEGSG